MKTPASTFPLSRQGTDADFMCLVKDALSVVQVGQPGDEVLRAQSAVTPMNKRGGREPFLFDLGDARFTTPGYIEYTGAGQQLIYSIQGSAQGGVLDFDFDGGGTELTCIPGAKLRGPFNRFLIKRNAQSAQSGTVMLRIQNQPDVDYTELARGFPGGVLGNPSGAGIGPAGAATQLYNSAAGNIPTAVTDGLSLSGVSGVRGVVISAAGSTISAGELHWWQFDTASALWGETDMLDVYALATVRRIWFPLDKQVWVPEGRIYPELRSATNSAGTGAFTVRLATWGN